ncbi:hypothetical protein Hanom_Chr07g00588221 [Helianthus anomalus]
MFLTSLLIFCFVGSSEEPQQRLVDETVLEPSVLKKKPLKKKKGSDEEDSPYDPEKPKKQRKKRKAVQAGIIPRNVRAKKAVAEPSKEKGGEAEKHVEVPKEPEVQEPIAEKETCGDDYVEVTGYKVATPCPPPQDKPESSQQKEIAFDDMFEGLNTASGIFTDDIPEDDYDMFNNEAVKELLQKVNNLEKEKAKT